MPVAVMTKPTSDGGKNLRFRAWSNEWKGLAKEAQQILRKYFENFPVRVSEACREFGLDVVLSPLPARISGEIRPIEGKPGYFRIRINRYESRNRQRFTAAHELSHFLLHRNLIDDGIVDTVLYRSNLSNTIEAQANRLAADILMPYELIQEYIEAYSIDLQDEDEIKNMADAFQVSDIALRFRLGF